MGKRQHQKDKMYITCAEYTHLYGGKKPVYMIVDLSLLLSLSLQPFEYPMCTPEGHVFDLLLSLQPFEYPMCTPEGHVFDLLSIVPWVKKFGTNPATGEAVEQLNIKTKTYRDLLSDEPFARKDLITLQIFRTTLLGFKAAGDLLLCVADEEKAKLHPAYHLKTTNLETRETLAELYKDYKGDELLASTMKPAEKKSTDKLNAAHYSTGKVSASFTSTAMTPETVQEADAIADDTVRYQYVKKKGYVRLHTNKGDLNLELHCDMVNVFVL
ncbi:UNVERIFIED_CONTAM: hypothetical protein FKN15_017517 [Acipenser sinensis]